MVKTHSDQSSLHASYAALDILISLTVNRFFLLTHQFHCLPLNIRHCLFVIPILRGISIRFRGKQLMKLQLIEKICHFYFVSTKINCLDIVI